VLIAAAKEVLPDVAVAGLQRYVLAGILAEIEKVRSTPKYKHLSWLIGMSSSGNYSPLCGGLTRV
jgi:hypothetical protein